MFEWWYEKQNNKGTNSYAPVESDEMYARRMRWKTLNFCSYVDLGQDMGISPYAISGTATAYDWQALRRRYIKEEALEYDETRKQRQYEIEQKHYKINDAISKVLQTQLQRSIEDLQKGHIDLKEFKEIQKLLSEIAKDERVNVHLPNHYSDIKQDVKADVKTDLGDLIDEKVVERVCNDK